MNRDDIKNAMREMLGLAAPEHQARMSDLLSNLTDEFESILTESENAANRVQELTENNETLRSVNAKLFLKVGTTDRENHNEQPAEQPIEENKITYENLFNEKGELI